jgi:hypothetical protein
VPFGSALSRDYFLSDDRLLLYENTACLSSNVIADEFADIVKFP